MEKDEYINVIITRMQIQDYTESDIIQELHNFGWLDESVLVNHFESRGNLHARHEYALKEV